MFSWESSREHKAERGGTVNSNNVFKRKHLVSNTLYNMQKSNKSTEKRFYKTSKTTATAVNRGPDEILTGTTKAGDGAMMVCRMCPVFKQVCRLKCRNCSPGAYYVHCKAVV